MDPDSIKAAEFQRQIVSTWEAAIEHERAQAEIGVLLKEFGPGTRWAKAQRNREALRRSLDATEDLVRTTAIALHAEAQQAEKASKKVDRVLYTRAAEAYQRYLDVFGAGGAGAAGATEPWSHRIHGIRRGRQAAGRQGHRAALLPRGHLVLQAGPARASGR
ncbi:MAG: hypothetical protein IPI49_26625 [Myxococcales bacterium]|nr:hypothetical protein [Myxococcales bacterium]